MLVFSVEWAGALDVWTPPWHRATAGRLSTVVGLAQMLLGLSLTDKQTVRVQQGTLWKLIHDPGRYGYRHSWQHYRTL